MTTKARLEIALWRKLCWKADADLEKVKHFYDHAMDEVERLNLVLHSIQVSTNLNQAHRRALHGRTVNVSSRRGPKFAKPQIHPP